MKHLLRKIFFWDEPTHGAFFGFTLLITVPWLLFSLFGGIMIVDFTLLRTGYPQILIISILLIAALYVAVLFLKMLVVCIRMTPRFWRRLLVLLVVYATIALIYAATMLLITFGSGMTFFDALAWPEIYLRWFIALAGILGIAYLFQPIAKPWKVLASSIAWIGALYVFLVICVSAHEPFRLGTLRELSCPSGLYLQLHVHALHDFFDLGGNGCFWFAALGTSLLAAAYLLSGNILADIGKHPTRQLFRRGVRIQWGVFAGIYVVALIFAIVETSNYRRAIQKLETHFGRPMTEAELGRQFYDGRKANPDFWRDMEKVLKEYQKTLAENEWEFEWRPYAMLPDDLYAKRKRAFLASKERILLESMVEAELEPPERKYAEDVLLVATSNPELSMLEKMSRMERWHILYAIDSGDFEAAAKAIARMDNICDFLQKDHYYISYVVWMRIGNIRMEALNKILESGIPTEKWLEEQLLILTELEAKVRLMEKQVLYGEAVCMLNSLHWLAHHAGNDTERPSLRYYSLRFYFPQGWCLAANNFKGVEKIFRVDEFAQFPDKATGYPCIVMICPDFYRASRKILGFTASCRILRGLVEVELLKRRTGNYPETMDNLPIDPFSGQPLKYRKGPCKINVHIYQKVRQDEDMPDDEGIDDQDMEDSYEFIKEERTVEAVQIWSIGPDGIDDGGILKKYPEDPGEKKKDDLRFLIQMK